MRTKTRTNLDRVLKALFICFFILLVAICSVLILSPLLTSKSHGEIDYDFAPIYQDSYEVEIDYDAIHYQDFVKELTDKMAGKSYAITLVNLSDPVKNFSINGDQVMVSASTYKLFTAYTMYKTGQAPACLADMIIYSDNNCPESWGKWNLTTSNARAIGATSTNLMATPTLTTSNDLALFLTKLYNGALLPEVQADKLLSMMKIQVYREGIPAGIPEADVADKVGFLDGILNDAGIVYSPKGDFVLVILTDGYSWRSIANTASEIYAKM